MSRLRSAVGIAPNGGVKNNWDLKPDSAVSQANIWWRWWWVKMFQPKHKCLKVHVAHKQTCSQSRWADVVILPFRAPSVFFFTLRAPPEPPGSPFSSSFWAACGANIVSWELGRTKKKNGGVHCECEWLYDFIHCFMFLKCAGKCCCCCCCFPPFFFCFSPEWWYRMGILWDLPLMYTLLLLEKEKKIQSNNKQGLQLLLWVMQLR